MKNFFKKLSTRASVAGVVLAAALGLGMYAFAAPSGPVTPASGGTNVSIDTSSLATSPAWTTLNGLVIQESVVGDIASGLHTVTLPSGWEFDTSSSIGTTISGGEITLNSPSITPGPGTTSFSFSVMSVSSVNVGSITFNNIKVRPTGTTPSTGNMTMTVGVIAGVNGTTNFGTLTTVPGVATKLAFTTQPSSSTVYGSLFAAQPVVKTQDQFGNNTVPGSAKNATLTLNGSGSILGTAVLDVGTSGTASFSGLSISDVGTGKTFTASAAGLTDAISSSFDITPKALTASITASSKTYDGDNTAVILTRTPTNLESGDSVTILGGTATFSDANKGTGKTVTATGMTLDTIGQYAKYTFAGTGTGTANISALGITVTADTGKTKVYGDTDPTFTYTNSPALIGTDSFSGSLTRATGESAGTYSINSLGSLTAGSNYSLSLVPANFTITTRPITVTAGTNSKEYDRTTSAATIPTITSGTLATGDTANFIETYDDKTAVSGKTLTPSGTVTSSNPGVNYNITFVATTTGIITKKALTVSSGLSVTPKNYDGNTSATVTGGAAVVGVISGDAVSPTVGLGGEVYSSASAGTHNVTGTLFTISGADAGNYSATPIVLSGVINPKPVTVTPTASQSKVYGDADPAFTYTTSALVGLDAVTGNPARATGESVGTYSINATGTLTAGSNYAVIVAPVNFTITTAPLTITAANKTKVYGAVDPAFTVTYSGLKNGDSAPSTLATLTRAVGSNVGTYDITPSAAVDTNYSISYATGTLSITQAPLTVTAVNNSKEYHTVPGADPALTYTASTLANGDNITVFSGNLVRVAGESIGTYAINQGTVTAGGNYNITYVPGTFSIVDTTAPVIAAHADVNAVADQLGGATASASYTAPTASDEGDGNLPAVCTPASGSVFSLGTTTVTCTKTDAHGNIATPTTFKVAVVPDVISKFAIAGAPASVDITAASTITVTGQDQYGNTVTNNSSTVALLTTDNGASLSNGFVTLTNGVATTQLTKATTGVAHVVVSSGTVTPKQASVTFTDASDRTAPVISSIATNKASYEATNDTNITVTVVEDNTASSVTVNGNAATETTPTSGIWTVTFAKSSSVGTQSLLVSAADISGNVSTRESSYNVVANVTIASIPTVALVGTAVQSAYSQTQANARFASGVQFSTTNASSVTVNGVSVAAAATITAATFASSTTLGVHTYNVVVTSSTGATANVTVSYQVNADAVVPVIPTIALSGSAIAPVYSVSQATTRFPSGVQFTTTNGATTTVNGLVVTSGGTVTAATSASSTSVGVHTYNVVVTSSTGHTAELTVSYQVNPDAVVAVTPTVALSGSTITSAYTATAAAARFASGLQFTTTNAASVTVNGASVAAGATITADSLSGATTLGAHTYNVIVTSSTGHTANITVAYQVNADTVTPVTPTVTLSGAAIQSAYSATQAAARFASGLQFSTTNASSVTVNGASVTAAATITAATLASSTSLGAHTYNVVVTSSTGHTANITVSYQVNADTVTPVTPTVTLIGAVASSSYTLSQAQSRFASGLQFTTTNAASVTVNGSSVTAGATITADSLSGATTLGAHTYNVIVTSSTGHTANITVSYQVNADAAVQGNGTLGVTGISTINSTMTADNTFTNGGSWTFFVTVPTNQSDLSLKFGDWVSGSNSIATAGNMRVYSAQSSNASASSTAITIVGANTYSSALTLTGDLDANTEGRQVQVTVDLKVPTGTAGGSYSTNYGVKSATSI